jgi:hypothetical protein
LFRALRIPSSYLPTGPDDGGSNFNDGRVGTAYIQELRFNKYCERLQSLINEHFDNEFKLYLHNKGINVDSNIFEVKFNPPQNFASYRQAEMDGVRMTNFTNVSQIPYLSKRFALKRFLGLSAEEMADNEKLWKEENVDEDVTLSAGAELRSVGITASGMGSDMSALSNATTPPTAPAEGMPSEQPPVEPAPPA